MEITDLNSVYYMENKDSYWIYNAEKHEPIQFKTNDYRLKVIFKNIMELEYFIGDDKKVYSRKECPERFFSEYIPRVFAFKPKIEMFEPINREKSKEFKVFNKIKETIYNSFHLSLSQIRLPEMNLFEIPNMLLIGSKEALTYQYLAQGDINKFFENQFEDYFLMGFWGHGLNSYAFYYIKSDKKGKIFLRLPFGGVYMDNKKEAVRIKNYLTRFFSLERKIWKISSYFTVLDSMGSAKIEITLKNGDKMEYKKSLYCSDNNYNKFLEILESVQ